MRIFSNLHLCTWIEFDWMNEEIRCITNKGKTAKKEWENDDYDFLWALYSVYKWN